MSIYIQANSDVVLLSIGWVQYHIILFICIFLGNGCSSEDNETSNTINNSDLCLVFVDGNFIETELDIEPEFLNGGYEGFVDELRPLLLYPEEARENNIEGLCIVSYEITVEGSVNNIVATQDPGGGIGSSAESAIGTTTDGISFRPGMLNGEKVRGKKELEIEFKFQ